MTTLGCQRLFICGFLFRLTVIVTARVLGSLPKIALVRLPCRQGEPTKTDRLLQSLAKDLSSGDEEDIK